MRIVLPLFGENVTTLRIGLPPSLGECRLNLSEQCGNSDGYV